MAGANVDGGEGGKGGSPPNGRTKKGPGKILPPTSKEGVSPLRNREWKGRDESKWRVGGGLSFLTIEQELRRENHVV